MPEQGEVQWTACISVRSGLRQELIVARELSLGGGLCPSRGKFCGSAYASLNPYVKNRQVWKCSGRDDCQHCSYRRNVSLTSPSVARVHERGQTVTSADRRTSATYRWWAGWLASNENCCSGDGSDAGYPQWMDHLHNGGFDIVLCDGHVKWQWTYRSKQLSMHDNLRNPAHWGPSL
ncbi:MAG: hypothetical protein H5T86_12545 [Armatimonadetes bacterium]|nr:hypothetical protein [Armatimonadota bacterium]